MTTSASPILRLQGLGKRYRRGGGGPSYRTLRESIGEWFRRGLRAEPKALESAEFWALRDIAFDAHAGDIIGIIGRNGAGKSTLLKLLARITTPTSGRIERRGRIASLLEVGTGFHPELSGRENIFLNGAILGLRRREVVQRFDEIVDFAGVEAFLDTPVKHYSSGMYVRLAFAVAAHLEQEILLVDEVLAVGDLAFQRKCLARIREASREEGRCVLFVSHNNAAVASLCNRGILLAGGRLEFDGSASEALAKYNESVAGGDLAYEVRPDAPCIAAVRLDADAMAAGTLALGIQIASPTPLRKPVIGVTAASTYGIPIFGVNTEMADLPELASSEWQPGWVRLTITGLPLVTGSYSLSIWLSDGSGSLDVKQDAVTFDFVGAVELPPNVSPVVAGSVAVAARWSADTPERTLTHGID